MMQKMKKISLMACSLLASAALVSGVCALPAAQSVSAETTASFVSVDTTSKSDWERAGYGTDGYLVFAGGKTAYSNMYTEQGNYGEGEEEPIQFYQSADKYLFYDSDCSISTDSDAPISRLLMNEGSDASWSDATKYMGEGGHWANQPDLYMPGTQTTCPVRLTNGHADLYRDRGIGFTLRETGKIYVTVYVLDWDKRVSADLPITVGLYSGIKSYTFYAYGSNNATTLAEYYGTPLAETTVTSQGSYVTFEIEEAGDYQIVAYYDNQGTVTARVNPMPTGLFFDKVQVEEVPDTRYEPAEPVAPTETVLVDTTSKSAWEANGYGTDGYIVFGGKKAYSDMYTEQGNDGKTEITLYYPGTKEVFYDSASTISTDTTAPISKLLINDCSGASWSDQSTSTYWVNQPDLYKPGTETTYPVRLTNGHTDDIYNDRGIGFTLRETGKIYVTVYVLDWSKKVSGSNPITVGLFSGMKNTTFYGYGLNPATTLEEHYGTPIVKTTVTSQGAYVTFEIEGAGNYQIVCYYDNQGTGKAPINPMMTGLFFDKEMCAEVTSTSLSLEGDIGVNYYVGAHGQDLTDAILQVEYPNGTFDQVSAVSKNADGTYKFQVKVAAKDYAAKMQACLFTEDGKTLSRVFEYSAADYVASVLKAGASVYGEDLVALVTALDDYGKAAANLFYAQENTFTADLSSVTLDTLGDYQFALVGEQSGVALTDFSLSLQSTTSLKIYFTATSLSGVVCKVDGVAVTPVKTGANEYCIEIENINAKDLDTNFVVSIGDCTLTLNTLSYAYRALEYSSNANLKTAMQALYLYNQAANVYFAKEA